MLNTHVNQHLLGHHKAALGDDIHGRGRHTGHVGLLVDNLLRINNQSSKIVSHQGEDLPPAAGQRTPESCPRSRQTQEAPSCLGSQACQGWHPQSRSPRQCCSPGRRKESGKPSGRSQTGKKFTSSGGYTDPTGLSRESSTTAGLRRRETEPFGPASSLIPRTEGRTGTAGSVLSLYTFSKRKKWRTRQK